MSDDGGYREFQWQQLITHLADRIQELVDENERLRQLAGDAERNRWIVKRCVVYDPDGHKIREEKT
jgi:hypothetical protein